MPKQGSIILYVHGNQKVRYDGQPRTSTSTLTQLLNYEGRTIVEGSRSHEHIMQIMRESNTGFSPLNSILACRPLAIFCFIIMSGSLKK